MSVERRAAAFATVWVAVAVAVGCAGAPTRTPSRTQSAAVSASESAARAFQRGDLQQARTLYNSALAAAQAVEDAELAGAALLNLTLVHARLGELPAAHAHVDRILSAPAFYGPKLQSQAATRKAILFLDSAEHDKALQWAAAARTQCADPCQLGAALADIRAYVALERGDAELAAATATSALEQAQQLGQEAEQASALRLLGRARTQLGQTTQAAEALARALALDRALGLPERIAQDLLLAAENEERRGDAARAREYNERALAVYSAAGLQKNADALRARLAKK